MSAQPSQFDSHRFVKRLTNAGVSEEVAEILAEEHVSLILPADVAAKSDVAAVSSEIAEVRAEAAQGRATIVAEFRDTLADYKTSTLKWMFAIMTAYTGIVMTAVVTLMVSLG